MLVSTEEIVTKEVQSRLLSLLISHVIVIIGVDGVRVSLLCQLWW